jgi:hypothetical protein
MEKKIVNALLLNPVSFGTLNYDENKIETRTQLITVSFDKPVPIKEFVLKNNTGMNAPGVSIKNNGSKVEIKEVKAEGSDLKRISGWLLQMKLRSTDGVQIEVFADRWQ